MYEWRTGRSCVYKNNIHLVFVTKYRRDVLTAEMLDRLKSIYQETCIQMDCEMLEFGMKQAVANDIKAMFTAPNLVEAQRLLQLTTEKYREKAPLLSAWMEENIPEGLTIFSFPQEHWKKLRTSNLAERVNKEIKRRTKIVGIFPNCDSCLRLVTALLVEMDEEWALGRAYLKLGYH